MSNQTKKSLLLTDVVPQLDDKGEAKPIEVLLEYQDKAPFGILITPARQVDDGCRVVIENHHGKLMCHVWATAASAGNEPTHSIEIEECLCDCQREGHFCSGFKGILAHMENGILITEPSKVERCDVCQVYESDAEALKALRKLLCEKRRSAY